LAAVGVLSATAGGALLPTSVCLVAKTFHQHCLKRARGTPASSLRFSGGPMAKLCSNVVRAQNKMKTKPVSLASWEKWFTLSTYVARRCWTNQQFHILHLPMK
jgi:hypothetical protein